MQNLKGHACLKDKYYKTWIVVYLKNLPIFNTYLLPISIPILTLFLKETLNPIDLKNYTDSEFLIYEISSIIRLPGSLIAKIQESDDRIHNFDRPKLYTSREKRKKNSFKPLQIP